MLPSIDTASVTHSYVHAAILQPPGKNEEGAWDGKNNGAYGYIYPEGACAPPLPQYVSAPNVPALFVFHASS